MNRNRRRLFEPDLYDVDRMEYIYELTEENEELRKENRRLVKLLTEMPKMERETPYRLTGTETYEQLRKELGDTADKLLSLWNNNKMRGENGEER